MLVAGKCCRGLLFKVEVLIIADVDPRNIASLKLLGKLGFVVSFMYAAGAALRLDVDAWWARPAGGRTRGLS